jgi:uncharacterized protein YndB with AHSA1/START domain
MTTTQSNDISDTNLRENDRVVVETLIAAPPERVFRAIVDRGQALQWGSNKMFQVIEWNLEPRPGGKWNFVSVHPGNPKRNEHHGEVLEIDPPRLLVYTWFASWHPDPSVETIVRYELTAVAGGTQLKVTHTGLAKLTGAQKSYSQGWIGLLNAIKQFVEAKS